MRGGLPQPSIQSLACTAEKCAAVKRIHALRLHTFMRCNGLAIHGMLGNLLVTMLIKVGSLNMAQNLFDTLIFTMDCTWNSLITSYIAFGESRRAFFLYRRMRKLSFYPSDRTFLALLVACIKENDVKLGNEIYADIFWKGLLRTNTYLGNMVVNMYAKFGLLVKAQEVFKILPSHNVVTWTALLAGYVQLGQDEEAQKLFDEMQGEGILPNAHTFACILKSCAITRAFNRGLQLHAEIARVGLLQSSEVLGCSLVDVYTKCGLLAKAQEVFDGLPFRDVALWTTLIAGYAQHEHGALALMCFQQMQIEGVSPNSLTLASSIAACGTIRASSMGTEIHVEISRKGLLERDIVLGSALVDMYAKRGFPLKAQEVFDELVVRDVITWNALIGGYVWQEQCEEALQCFEEMQLGRIDPDATTYALVLNACSDMENLTRGIEIHTEIADTGLMVGHPIVGNALVSMYAKWGMLAKAQEVFDELPTQNVASWTALMSGFTEHNYSVDALVAYYKMQQEGILPDLLTLAISLKACGTSKAAEKGKQIHAQIAQMGYLQKDEALGNALIDMYAKNGFLHEAHEHFNELRVHDVVSWTALIAGYTEHNMGEEALDCYIKMRQKGVSPDPITFDYVLKACGSTGNVDQGREIHMEVQSNGLLKEDFLLGNALVDMYAKCGMLAKAKEVFDSLPLRDVVSWTALITGYAQQGQSESVIRLFDMMRDEGKTPNSVTFISVLAACSHAGLVEKGEAYFDGMVNVYGISPTLEHHTCMVDLLGRAGQLERALEMMEKAFPHPKIEMWLTILGACQKWSNVDVGQRAFEQVLLLDEKERSAYICMYNIFAQAGMREDASRVEALRTSAKKKQEALRTDNHARQKHKPECAASFASMYPC